MIARLVQGSRDVASSSSSIPDTPETSANPWRKERTCLLCQTPVGHGFLRTKKHVCKFCLHAVCSTCSPNRRYSEKTRKQERICTNCEESLEPEERGMRRAVTSLDVLEETEDRLKMETALRQAIESKYAVAEATMDRRMKEMEAALSETAKFKQEAEELAENLRLEREKSKEMEEFMGKIAEMALGKPVLEEICEEKAREVLNRLGILAQFWTDNQPKPLNLICEPVYTVSIPSNPQNLQKLPKSMEIFTCETMEIAYIPCQTVSIPSNLPELPKSIGKSTFETIEIAYIPSQSPSYAHLSFTTATYSLPSQLPEPYKSALPVLDTSTTPSTPIHPRKSGSNGPESPSKCLRCEELTAELCKLRDTLALVPRMSRAGSAVLNARSTESCQCTTT